MVVYSDPVGTFRFRSPLIDQGYAAVLIENRSESRFWCSDLVQVWVSDGQRWKSAGIGILEDISATGACIQLEQPVKSGLKIKFKHPDWKAEGVVRHCYWREIGYFVGMEFAGGQKWSPEVFRPKHMVDPLKVVAARTRTQKRARAAGAGS